MRLILASKSPRRKDILQKLNLNFEVIASGSEEVTEKTKPEEMVKDLALQKAKNVASKLREPATIIAADTIVYHDEKILGKPINENEAFDMLSRLQGNWHTVYTGVCIIKETGEYLNYFEKSKVHMAAQSKQSIWNYIKTGSPMDKAGAYGVQDDACNFVDIIEGELETVIGLPVVRLKQELKLN